MKKPKIVPYGTPFSDLINESGNSFRCFTTPGSQSVFETRMAAQISANLWPKFEQSKPPRRSPSLKRLQHVTLADLSLAKDLLGIRKCLPRISYVAPAHAQLFRLEDLYSQNIVESYFRYLYGDPDANAATSTTRDQMSRIVLAAMGECNGLLYRLKMIFQRMRPFQAVYLCEQEGFEYLGARSAYSPALPSGHCLQGIYSACRIFEANEDGSLLPKLSAGQIEHLKQLAVDIGDRRVFAGVHYPTDNIASWFCMAELIPACFPQMGEAVKKFLVDSLQKSIVFNALERSDSPWHRSAVIWLQKALND